MKYLALPLALLLPVGAASACNYGIGACYNVGIAYPVPTITYFAPQVTYYAPPPVVSYAQPAPVQVDPGYAAAAPVCPVQVASYAAAAGGCGLGIGYGTSRFGFAGLGANFYGAFYGHRLGFFNRFSFRTNRFGFVAGVNRFGFNRGLGGVGGRRLGLAGFRARARTGLGRAGLLPVARRAPRVQVNIGRFGRGTFGRAVGLAGFRARGRGRR